MKKTIEYDMETTERRRKIISEREEESFDRWVARNGQAFTVDGVIDEKEYLRL